MVDYGFLTDAVGVPATLELVAEEANELAYAALKLARMVRGENKVFGKTKVELLQNLTEEVTDVQVCIKELIGAGLVDEYSVSKIEKEKLRRMEERLSGTSEEDRETGA